MSNLVRCTSCRGTKKILSMGGIVKSCPECKGVGWIESNEAAPKEEIKVENLKNLNGEPVKARKRPGPKPRVQKEMNLGN